MRDKAGLNVENPYLTGIYAPVDTELDCSDLKVIGDIPKDLNGVMLRNGPNPKYAPKGRYHWFDGDAMLHAVHFEAGKASYRNRWLDTRGLQAEVEAGESLFNGLIEPDFSNPLGPIKDSANTDVLFHRDKVLALWYRTGEPYAVDPLTLATEGVETFADTLALPISAHAKVDDRTGEMMVFHLGPTPPYMFYGVVSPQGQVSNWVPVELPGQRFSHDIAITQHYTVLMDLPVFYDEKALKSNKWRMDFFRDLPSRFGVIPRHGSASDIRWFEADPCYIYHVINAWEEADELVMDVCRVAEPMPPRDSNTGSLDRMLKVLSEALSQAYFHRYRFNLATGTTTEEIIDERITEFPSINLNYMGYPSRFAYNATIRPANTLLFDGIAKYDNLNNSCEVMHWEEGCWGSESPFAPRDNAVDEDDGYILSFVHDENSGQSECRILDAQNIQAPPLARVLMPQRVPLGFHATWIPGDKLDRGAL